jgi:hypothetical protein
MSKFTQLIDGYLNAPADDDRYQEIAYGLLRDEVEADLANDPEYRDLPDGDFEGALTDWVDVLIQRRRGELAGRR